MSNNDKFRRFTDRIAINYRFNNVLELESDPGTILISEEQLRREVLPFLLKTVINFVRRVPEILEVRCIGYYIRERINPSQFLKELSKRLSEFCRKICIDDDKCNLMKELIEELYEYSKFMPSAKAIDKLLRTDYLSVLLELALLCVNEKSDRYYVLVKPRPIYGVDMPPELFDIVIIYSDVCKIVLEDVKYVPLIAYRDSIELVLKVDNLIHSFLNKVYKARSLILKLVGVKHANVEALLSLHTPCRDFRKLRLIEDLAEERFCYRNVVYRVIQEGLNVSIKYKVVDLYRDVPEI
ncbi:MAG: hypothetical protein GXO23_02105 [Crenarchaeota archaeon]|nr:hypothetical protein [Thermoproteota archaeon]